MDYQSFESSWDSRQRRKPRSKFQKFKEAYLPFIIIATTILIVLVIVIGSSISSDPAHNDGTTSGVGGASMEALNQEAQQLMQEASALAENYYYQEALELLGTFSGDISQFQELRNLYNSYSKITRSMIAWRANEVPCLSFQVLIEDLAAALTDPKYSESYNKKFTSTGEFSKILNQLYENGYVLVNLEDLYEVSEDGSTYKESVLLLPSGKKPIMLAETQCNYYPYMNGAGFASKLCYKDGRFYNERMGRNGQLEEGSFDLVPILEDFLADHPDFSYQNARAILAFTGWGDGDEGIWGYRIGYAQEKEEVKAVADALKETGYTLACNSYYRRDYSASSAGSIQDDLQMWEHIEAVIGAVDVLVFAHGSDIGTSYTDNQKFQPLYEAGFRYFLSSGEFLWNEVSSQYVRHNRLLVNGYNLQHHSEMFEGLFDASTVSNPLRGNIEK